MLDIRWTYMPYKKGRLPTFGYDCLSLYGHASFYCSNKRRAYNGIRRIDSISLDILTMSRVPCVNLFYIASAR